MLKPGCLARLSCRQASRTKLMRRMMIVVVACQLWCRGRGMVAREIVVERKLSVSSRRHFGGLVQRLR